MLYQKYFQILSDSRIPPSHIFMQWHITIPLFSVYSGRNRSGISPDSLSHYHTQNLHMIMFTQQLFNYADTILAHCFYNYNHIRDTSEFFLLHKPDPNPKRSHIYNYCKQYNSGQYHSPVQSIQPCIDCVC